MNRQTRINYQEAAYAAEQRRDWAAAQRYWLLAHEVASRANLDDLARGCYVAAQFAASRVPTRPA